LAGESRLVIEAKPDVPFHVRELVTISFDNNEKAFAFFFDAAAQSPSSASPEI